MNLAKTVLCKCRLLFRHARRSMTIQHKAVLGGDMGTYVVHMYMFGSVYVWYANCWQQCRPMKNTSCYGHKNRVNNLHCLLHLTYNHCLKSSTSTGSCTNLMSSSGVELLGTCSVLNSKYNLLLKQLLTHQDVLVKNQVSCTQQLQCLFG